MITGYNTDVRHRGLVFHVQTEDKGLSNPCVESLVYVGGQIVTRKRTEYARLLKEEEDSKETVAALMEKQHRQTIAEIRAGRLDGDSSAQVEAADTEPTGAQIEALPVEAPVEADGRSLDQVILDYLSTEAEQEHLILVMDSPDELQLGQDALLAFYAKSSIGGAAIEDAEIEAKLISTESEPSLLAAGKTNSQGKLHLRIHIPDLRRGTAALIVTAASAVGTAEIKHLI